MQRDPIVVKASELIRLGLMPSAQEIKAGKVSDFVKSKSSIDEEAYDLVSAFPEHTIHRHIVFSIERQTELDYDDERSNKHWHKGVVLIMYVYSSPHISNTGMLSVILRDLRERTLDERPETPESREGD